MSKQVDDGQAGCVIFNPRVFSIFGEHIKVVIRFYFLSIYKLGTN